MNNNILISLNTILVSRIHLACTVNGNCVKSVTCGTISNEICFSSLDLLGHNPQVIFYGDSKNCI